MKAAKTDMNHGLLESPEHPFPGARQLRRDFSMLYAANGLVGLVFAATGPLAVILAVGSQGGLSQPQLASWVFGVFFLNGILTAVSSWFYQQPLSFFWTIPGTVLVGPTLAHLEWPEITGAFLVTGLLILVLGLTGWVRKIMEIIPMPIVMGMVAGVFLSFGLDLAQALVDDVLIAGPMVALFLGLSWSTSWGRRVPPILGALIVGVLMVALAGGFAGGFGGGTGTTQVLAVGGAPATGEHDFRGLRPVVRAGFVRRLGVHLPVRTDERAVDHLG